MISETLNSWPAVSWDVLGGADQDIQTVSSWTRYFSILRENLAEAPSALARVSRGMEEAVQEIPSPQDH